MMAIASTVTAQHCTIDQLTNVQPHPQFNTAALGAAINADGSRITFWSNGNLTGTNTDPAGAAPTTSVYLYDSNRIPPLTQLSPANVFSVSGDNAISAGGNRVLYSTGSTDPRVIHLWDQNQGDRVLPISFGDALSPDGDYVVGAEFAPSGANRDLFLYQISTDTVKQLTNTTSGQSLSPVVSANGTHVAFRSNAFPESDGTSFVAYVLEVSSGARTPITGIGCGGGIDPRPSISSDGTRVVYDSCTGGTKLYNVINQQLTSIPIGDSFISGNGARIVNTSRCIPTGTCPFGLDLYTIATGTQARVLQFSSDEDSLDIIRNSGVLRFTLRYCIAMLF
jgi:hypothetical protein